MNSLLGRVFTSCILACASATASAQLTLADDFSATAREARARRVPIMLVFTEESCPYCVRAKRDHLAPLQASRDFGHRVIVREIDVKQDRRMVDFAGTETTPSALARRYAVRMVPTVIVVDATGRRLGDPIVGLIIQDFYQLYLERAVDLAHAQMEKAR